MDFGFLPVGPCLQYHMVAVMFSWDMTLCEWVFRSQLSELM